MSRINWVRLIVGGLVAAIIAFLTDGFLHEQLLSADWKAVYNSLGAPEPVEHGSHMIYFVSSNWDGAWYRFLCMS